LNLNPLSNMKRTFPIFAIALAALPLHGAPEADPSQKLREQLKATMLQLRTVQSESATIQAALAAAEAKTKTLDSKVAELDKRNATLSQQANADKAAAESTIATLNNKLAEREKRITEFTEALAKWKEGYQKAAEVARTKEAERAKLLSESIELKRTLADRETKNIALFNTSNEILNRFENYALGKALGAREPFISTTRVKVESLVQGYKDKILDNRISAATTKP
jgi:DNA repair exonuclease SbcCD ATPase subunit